MPQRSFKSRGGLSRGSRVMDINQINFNKLKLLVLDVDGLRTDGSLYFTNNGEELKAFTSQDGLGMTVADANSEVKSRAAWCSTRRGGQGAAREACDFILKQRTIS